MYCKKCKEELPKNAKFCPFCGSDKSLISNNDYEKQEIENEIQHVDNNVAKSKEKKGHSSKSKDAKSKSKNKGNKHTDSKSTKDKKTNNGNRKNSNQNYKDKKVEYNNQTVYKKNSNIFAIFLLLIIIIVLAGVIVVGGYIWYTKYRNIENNPSNIETGIEQTVNTIKNEVSNTVDGVTDSINSLKNEFDISGTYKGYINNGKDKIDVTYIISQEQQEVTFGEDKSSMVSGTFNELTNTLNVEYNGYTYNLVFTKEAEKINVNGVVTSLNLSSLIQEIYLEKQ